MKNILRIWLFLFLCGIAGYSFANENIPDVVLPGTNQQVKVITGTVFDEFREPLAGATVVIKGTTKGVITDIDGHFSIDAPESEVLIVNFLGMEPLEFTVGTPSNYLITMEPKKNELDDVTVVAFARQKKESVISSITTIKPAELKVPSSNLTTALAGRLAGVIAYQTSGEPGQDNANFFIRGVTTFGYKTDPLILIDNVELSTDDLARLNVDDIASFSIMKDATATALYGARGANGVILVTTKEGREGPAKVSFRIENSISTPTRMIELADPITYMKLGNEAVRTRNPLGVLPYSQEKIERTAAGDNPLIYPAVDWYDELFNSYAMNQRVNMSISGGGGVARYYVAASYTKDNGVIKMDKQNNFNSGIDLQKYTVRSNVNINLTPTTEAIIRVQGSFDDYQGPIDGGTDLFNKVIRTNPVLFPKYFSKTGQNERATHILFGNYNDGSYLNPYADMVKGYKESNRTLMLAQGEIKQNFDFLLKGLTARGLISTTRYSYTDVTRNYTPYYYQIGSYDRATDEYTLLALNPDGGSEELGYKEGQKDIKSTNYIELSVAYNREFNKHGVSGMLVYTRQEERISNAGTVQLSLPYRNQGVSGRFTYSYDRRYFGEFNFGYNGSERFSAHERYGFFPSIGAGYIISNEKFWEPLTKYVQKLKLKYTFGLVGNDAIGDSSDRFFYLSQVNSNDGGKSQVFGSEYGNTINGITVNRYANSQITWETARKSNYGIEIGLLDNNMEIQLDIFHEYRKNILMNRSYIPSTMGLSAAVRANVGEAASRGFDMSIDYNLVTRKDFWLTGRFNFTYATNEYKVLDEPFYELQGTPWRSQRGQSLNQRWGYIAERLFVDDADIANAPDQSGLGFYEAGDIKYKDINNDGQITEVDMVPIGYPTIPQITYGFGFSTGYKNLDLSMFFQGNGKVAFFLDPNAISPFIDTDGNDAISSENTLMKAIADSYWSEGNRDNYAFWPRLANRTMENNNQISTWWMRNGAFFRVKSLEVGYSLPARVNRTLGIDNLRIYLSGNNLLTFSNFKLWDPEMGGNGLGYPLQRVYNIGLTLNF